MICCSDGAGRHRGQRVDQREVAVGGDVLLDALRVDPAGVLEHDLRLPREERLRQVTGEARDRFAGQAGGDRRRVGRRHRLVQAMGGLGGDERAFLAQAQAPDALHPAVRVRSAFTACSSAVLTWSACDERQLAARHTRSSCPSASARARSASAIWTRSSRVIVDPVPDALPHLFRRELDRHFAVEHGGGGEAARAEAAGREQRHGAVGRGLAGLDAGRRRRLVDERAAALDVAGGAGADRRRCGGPAA